jgi:hypothetical protein
MSGIGSRRELDAAVVDFLTLRPEQAQRVIDGIAEQVVLAGREEIAPHRYQLVRHQQPL